VDRDNQFERLRAIRRLLDDQFRLPGTSIRFGWDPLIGLVPWAGDLVTAAMACAIIVHAHRSGVPRLVQLRMLLNVAIDLVTGMVPVLGDLVDFAWKSNARNMALLERQAARPLPATTTGDWAFVTVVLVIVAVLAATPLAVLYLLGRSLI
jgi:Domain of unknown function (DUF4112)